MSTKRQMKKENRQSESLGHRLEDLYRRGADEAFLDLVHERCRNLPELPAAGCHGEVVDRALRRALMSRDWHQTGRILKRLRRDVAGGRPMVRLAEAALHLVDGRLDEARAGLAGLTGSGNGASPVPDSLVTALEALTEPVVPGDSYVQELARRLELLREQGFRAASEDIRSFEVILAALEVGVAGDAAASKLLSAASERLWLLETLDALERDLRRDLEGGMNRILGPFLEQAVEWWGALALVLPAAPPWNLVRPLHHALRLSWRRLLQMLSDQEGPEAWPILSSRKAGFLALDLEAEGGEVNQAGEAARLWRDWRDHLFLRRFRKLGELLESKSRGEKDPERLADLWEAELWAWRQEARTNPGAGEAARAALARLERFASDADHRISPERRPELARRLREGLLDLCELDDYSRYFLNAAAALLELLEDDAAILAVALASAVCSSDDRAVDRFTKRIATRGVASEEEQEEVLGVMTHLAKEEWTDIARSLPRLRPLLDGKHLEAADRRLSRAIVDDFISDLANGWRPEDLREMRLLLGSVRRALPEVTVLATLDRACNCLEAGVEAREVLRLFLEESPGLEEALLVYRVVNAGYPWAPDDQTAIQTVWQARTAVIERIDHRWPVWWRHLSDLVDDAEEEEVQRLGIRLREILEQKGLTPTDQVMLRDALARLLPDKEMDESEKGEPEDEDWEEEPVTDGSYLREISLLERLFPPPRLVMKPLEPTPGSLQLQDLQPLLRPMRRQAVEEALRVGLRESRA